MSASTFNPDEWLARYEAAGGGWIVQHGRPALLAPTGAEVAHAIAELEANGRRTAVMGLIVERQRAKELAAAE